MKRSIYVPLRLFVALLVLASMPMSRAEINKAADRLKVGVVQMALGRTIADNRDRIVFWISQAAARGVRVAVFPESALRGEGNDDPALVDEAVAAIRRAAGEHKIYVLCGGASYAPQANKDVNWMFAVGPDGREIFRYNKIYDQHNAAMPGVFPIDGVSCSAFICADRWLRGLEEIPIQQGSQITFELSCNFASEWVAPYQWYWYVPRALRNNVWVVFANTGNKVAGVLDDPSQPRELRHGHSAVIAPDGAIAAAARDDVETIVVADLDLARATRAEAQARAAHPALRPFWEAGLKLQGGQAVDAPQLTPLKSAEVEVTIAAAQVNGNTRARAIVDEMVSMIRQARARNADVVAFPARSVAASALEQLQRAARASGITVVVGMEHRVDGALRNSAFVIGPDGALLTRYDQLSASPPFQPGTDPAAMWFRVKGVPAVVTIGRDALWTELSELAAVAGAQIHVHLDHDTASGPDADLRRLQVGANLASFQTFSATVNVTGSAIWDDLRDNDERRAEVRGLPRLNTGAVEVYSPFSANLVARAGAGAQLIVATRRVGPANPYHPRRTASLNPQMAAWYRLGAAIIRPVPPLIPSLDLLSRASSPSLSTSQRTRERDGVRVAARLFKGRIAISADGNQNDPDDWIASPMALAILAEAGVKERLVHFDYNCILPETNPEWEKTHAESVLGAAERYGFDKSVFFDCRRNVDAAVASIARAINASSADDPLYFVIAGPMEVPYLAIQKSDPAKRKFVYCISHSRWNDGFAANYKFTFTKRNVIEQEVHWVQIPDQNRLLSFGRYGRPSAPEEFAPYFWMRDSNDPKVQFLWERMRVSTRPDPSDAGMTYFLVSGDEQCDPAKLKRLIEDHHPPAPIAARKQVRIEAENFRQLDGFVVEDSNDRNASHRLNIRLADGTGTGHIRTRFDEPFTPIAGRYDVTIRYLDEKGVRCRFAFFVNGVARGSEWQSSGEGRGWTNQTIPDVEIRVGDEIRVDGTGPACRVDYVQLDAVESMTTGNEARLKKTRK